MESVPPASSEFEHISLGDFRLERRARSLLAAHGRDPAASFPEALGNEAALEALYRFVGNDSVDLESLVGAHAREGWRRSVEAGGPLLIVHDSSEFQYEGEAPRPGLVRRGKVQCFTGHFALAVAEVEAPVVHGVLGCRAYVVEDNRWYMATENRTMLELLRGSERWADLVVSTRQAAPEGLELIHVMDREADDYSLWTDIAEQGDDFVIRSQHNRAESSSDARFDALLDGEEYLVSRSVQLSRRGRKAPPRSQKSHPPRQRRTARLSIRARQVEVRRPRDVAIGEPSMTVSVVEVVEQDPPDGVQPVHWRLVSTLPCETPEAAVRIVDIYRKRWLIEEFFKALKTGCSAEKRQARSLWTLLNSIGLLIPLAWRLLVLRSLARHSPDKLLTEALDPIELAALRQLDGKRRLGDSPTLAQGLAAIAAIGGHKKSNGEPGWLVLGRGFQRLLDTAEGWRAALRAVNNGGLPGAL